MLDAIKLSLPQKGHDKPNLKRAHVESPAANLEYSYRTITRKDMKASAHGHLSCYCPKVFIMAISWS